MILIILIPLWGRNIISFEFEEYNVRIYYPEDYNKILLTNGVIFHSEQYNAAFSMLVAESDISVEQHTRIIEERYNAVNLIDSSEIYLNNDELNMFGIDNGIRSYFQYIEENHYVNKSLLTMKKDNIAYMIISEFEGELPEQEIDIINDCIGRFRVNYNE